MLFFAVVMVACTGTDTETIVKQTQCQDGTTVTGDETCPTVETDTTPSQETTPNDAQETTPNDAQETTPNDDDEDTNRGADGCFQLPSTNTNYTAGNGDEVICGTDVDNTIRGGKGDDTIYGRGGDDTLYGEAHRDILKGEAGNDTLIGGEDQDTLDGGGDTDTVDYNQEGGDGAVIVDLIAGSATDTYGDEDTLISIENVKGTAGSKGVDIIKGNNDPNIIDGGDNVTDDNAATSDKLDGRGGKDTIVVRKATFNLATAQNASAGDPNIKNFENIEGRGTKQTTTDGTTTTLYIALELTGDNKANTITGADGGAVADTINGAGGSDMLYGRRGNDILNGGPGKDTLDGGLGNDCFQLSLNDLDTVISDFVSGNDMIRLYISTDEQSELDKEARKSNDTDGISDVTVAPMAKDNKIVLIETYTETTADNPTTTTINEAKTEMKENSIRNLISIRGLKEDSNFEFGPSALCTGITTDDLT